MSPADKPEDKLIDDDRELDRWFKQYLRDLQRKGRRGDGGNANYKLTPDA